MLGDSNLPVTGGVVLTALAYGAIALFVTGPLVGERMIAKSNWEEQCQSGLVRASEERAMDSLPVIPDLGCDSVFGTLFGQEGNAFCRKHGGQFGRLPFLDQLEVQKRRAEERIRRQLENASHEAQSRCSCAVAKALQDERTSLAITAGSLRLVTPRSVREFPAALQSALGSDQCKMKG